MTILRQLAIYFTLMLVLIFAGSLTLSIRDARNLQLTQLRTHAQDTATSLGVAIAANDPANIASVDSMIDAVFDRGYYQRIRFTNTDGEILVNSEHKIELEGVPGWFIRLVSFKAPEVATEINNGLDAGWHIAGQQPSRACLPQFVGKNQSQSHSVFRWFVDCHVWPGNLTQHCFAPSEAHPEAGRCHLPAPV